MEGNASGPAAPCEAWFCHWRGFDRGCSVGIILGVLGLINAGWYSILKARLFDELPSRSGTAIAVSNVGNLVGALIPYGVGVFAARFGLGAAMWLLLAGPFLIAALLPRGEGRRAP